VNRRSLLVILGCLALLALAVCVRLLVGSGNLSFPESGAVWDLRLQRVVSGVVVGVCLAVAGVLLQTLLRNPLASPDLLGLSAGAGLAVSITIVIGYHTTGSIAPAWVSAAPATIGSVGTLALVYLLSQRRGFVEPVSLILTGVIVGVMCGAGQDVMGRLLPDGGVAASRLFIGALRDGVDTTNLWGSAAIALAGTSVALGMARWLDASVMSDDEALSVGVPVRTVRLVLFGIAGVLTAVSVSLAGPIGFVGLIVPHAVRLTAGPSHVPLLLGSAIAGAALVVGADAGVKSLVLPSGRLPLGVITAAIGGPVFLILLRRVLREGA